MHCLSKKAYLDLSSVFSKHLSSPPTSLSAYPKCMLTPSPMLCKITKLFLYVLCTEDDNSCYRNVCKMSVVSFALAVVFIIRLFSTSAFRVPNFFIWLLNTPHQGKASQQFKKSPQVQNLVNQDRGKITSRRQK